MRFGPPSVGRYDVANAVLSEVGGARSPDGTATDIAGYRSGGARLHYRLIGVIWRFGDFPFKWPRQFPVTPFTWSYDGTWHCRLCRLFYASVERRTVGPDLWASDPYRAS